MPVYLTPGVYRRPQPVENGDIRLVRTDVAGFVGIAERGPLLRPSATPDEAREVAVRLTSWSQFRATFGGFVPYGYLAYAVRAFFDNGGTTCYVVRVAGLKSAKGFLLPRAASFPLPAMPKVSAGRSTVVALGTAAKLADSELQISDETARYEDRIQAGDLVQIKSAEGTEVSWVTARKSNTIQLAQKLAGAPHPPGTMVTKYTPGLIVTARSPGSWGNRIKVTISPLKAGETVEEFSLRVTLVPGLDPSAPVEEEYYHRLSVVKGPFFVLDRVNNFSNLVTLSSWEAASPIAPLLLGTEPLAPAKKRPNVFPLPRPVRLQGGHDSHDGFTVGDFTGGPDDLRGLRILEEIDEVAILCVPDAVFEPQVVLPVQLSSRADPCANASHVDESLSPSDNEAAIPRPIDTVGLSKREIDQEVFAAGIYRAMIDQCERLHDRVAILDYPQNKKKSDLQNHWEKQFVTRFAAIYYPWLKVPDPLGMEGPSRRLPAAGHVAGIYARIDNQFGVDRPPANAALEFVTDVVESLTDLDQQNLNPYGINAIRSFPGRGIRVWGARSLAGLDDANWQFIHVRRLMSMIEESVNKSTQWAVFEPNDFALRQTLVHSLSVFLETIWRKGGLKGLRPSDGFYVKCDETNNTPAVIDAGQIICEVGVAVAAAMEFLVFEIRRNRGAVELIKTAGN
jgi:phage tail sheath protein FI